MTKATFVFAAAVLASCIPAAAPRSTPTIEPSAATATATLASSPSPTPTPDPTRLLGTVPVPTLLPKAEFGSLSITLDVFSAAGQPAEDRVWRAEAFAADNTYVSRAATALGMTGPGITGAAPGGGPPWMLWWASDSVLAVNSASGEVFFFAGARDDGPHGPGPARADPARALESLVTTLGTRAAFTPQPGYLQAFRGSEVTASFTEITGGTWTASGSRDAAILFARYRSPLGLELTIYDTDEVGLITSRLRPVAVAHRPLGRLVGGEIYPITPFGEAAKELRAAPARFLRLLSGAPSGPLKLTVDQSGVFIGHAWAQTSASDLRRAGRTLVPVWVFAASGTTAAGLPVSALFTVDAVVPELRAPPASGALAIDADFLLRQQLTQLGGHRPGLRDPKQVAQDFLGASCGAVELTSVDADRYSGTASCNGVRTTFTVSRAFPGLAESIWYVSEPRR